MKATISSQEAKSRHRSPANGQPSLADALFTSASDIDLLIVADGLTLEDVYSAVAPVETLLDRQVSPTLYTTKEFSKRRDDQNPLLMRILPGPKTILMGSIDGE